MTRLNSTQSTIITLYDAITDSPVYRASTLQFDKQLELFTVWVKNLAKETKSYAEKLKELNELTLSLTSKLDLTMYHYLLGSEMTFTAASSFTDALKTNLIFKTKMVSDLEANLILPIQQFVDTHLRDFKNFRHQHQKALEKYENTLKNDSDHSSTYIQQLETSRKQYILLSSEHVIRITKLRSALEHCLVSQFSATTISRKDFYNDAQVWKELNAMLYSWSQWLADDDRTCQIELRSQQLAQQILEKEFMETLQHIDDIQVKSNLSTTKSGYLLFKSTESSIWERQWFFAHNGYFGFCKVNEFDTGATVTLELCIPLSFCQVNSLDDTDRHFQLMTKQTSSKVYLILQAETEQEKQDWITILLQKGTIASSSSSSSSSSNTTTKNRPSSIILGNYDPTNHDPSHPRSPALLIPKSKSTTVVSTPTAIPVTLSTNTSSNVSGYSNLSNLSTSPGGTVRSTLSGSHSTTTTYSSNSSKQRGIIPSIKLLSTSKNELHLSNAPSMTPLLLFSISNQLLQNDVSTTQSKPYDILSGNSKMWGNPQSIIPRGITLDWTHKQLDVTRASDTYQSIQRKTIWPPSPMITQLCIPDLPGYTTYLSNKNNELRNLFFGVSSDEVVLDVFSGSLHKKHHSSSATNLNDHQKLSDFGYCYNGSGYMTQHTFWFYSNISANCINTVALKWKDVEDIQVIENSRLMIHVTGSTDATNQDFTTPLVFSTRLDDIDTLVEKLRFFVYSAKLANPMQLRNMYRKILNISSTSSSLSYSPTQQSMTEMSASESSSACISPTPPVLSDRMASSETTATLDTTTTLVSSDENGSRTATPIIHKKPAKKTKKKNITQSFVDPDSLPKEIQQPSGPVSCDCDDHLDRRDAELVLPISAKRLFELMFSDESTAPPSNGGVWNAKTEGIEGHDLRVSHWESLSTDEPQQGLMKRTLKYWMPVANPVVRMKEAEVVETQILLKKQDYICYVVQISTKTEALPFADAFVPSVRYCITYVDDSQCKLSCHLGVKWLKWVMAKLIVTKAALAGMSDSVGVFVPILKEAAATIQSTVEETRQLRQASSNDVEVSEYEDEEEDNDDGGRWDTSSIVELDNKKLEATTTTTKPIADMITNTGMTMQTITTSNSHRSSSTAQQTDTTANTSSSTINDASSKWKSTSSNISNTNKTIPSTSTAAYSKSTTKTTVSPRLIKEKLTDESGEEVPSMVKAAVDSIWPPSEWTIGIILIGCLLYAFWFVSPSRMNGITTEQMCGAKNGQLVSHAIYLRDLDEGFLQKSLQPPYAGSQSYELFIQTKRDERQHVWYDGQHYRLAMEYGNSRAQLGVLRHDVISMFQALNMADSYLLENEYLNWLLDYRQRCRGEKDLMNDQALEFNDTMICDQVKIHIGTYF